MSRTDQVRQALRELGQATAREVADHLQVQSRAEVAAVGTALKDLFQSGEVGRGKEGSGPKKYYFILDLNRLPISKQAKLWQAMQIKSARAEVWRVADLAMLAGSNLDYAKRYVRYCVGQGLVERIHYTGGNAAWYRLTPGQENQEAPAWNRRAVERKKKPADHRPEACATVAPPVLTASPQERLNAALGEFGRTMVEIAGSCKRAQEIIQQMQDEIRTLKEAGYDEPVEPTDGHH